MERLLIAVVLAAAAVVVAVIVQRRRPDPPTRTGYNVPAQIDRADFVDPHKPWLVAVFTSDSCEVCADTWAKASALASDQVAVHEAEVGVAADLHARYAIDGVPTLVVADGAGVVVSGFLGPVSAADLWAAVADAREPGSVPAGCDPSVCEPGGAEMIEIPEPVDREGRDAGLGEGR